MATQPNDPRPPLPGPPGTPSASTEASLPDVIFPDHAARALLLWPGLDRTRLAGTKGDPRRIARLVSRRTNLPPEAILRMLGVRPGSDPRGDAGREDDGSDRT